ncbi:MerR family transcriptional regulator [Glycomyces xiaoerkulensis]|uniref:MerR family transcriptional regulator n=1 Tax=Glycomyces xiaoerkulensis TaxID=2038139 RepID=UPI000C264F25|nr:MerR family transcriptional regulator [Glycomyces xiaoerkulensis]
MRIGELAERAGLTKDAVRFYEKIGLVESRRLPNGYRDFPPETLPWLDYVRTAQRLGFTLAEIAEHGRQLHDAPDSAAELSALFEEKIEVIDRRMAQLTSLRAELEQRVGTGCPMQPVGATARRAQRPSLAGPTPGATPRRSTTGPA